MRNTWTWMALLAMGCSAATESDEKAEEATFAGHACEIDPERSIFVRDARVLDGARSLPGGSWAFGTLVRNMAPESADLGSWLGGAFERRACELPPSYGVSCGEQKKLLDLDTVPARLLAIVNRVDLASDATPAGELRLVYQLPEVQQVPDREGARLFNFELDLSAVRDEHGEPIARETWAARFAALSTVAVESEAYAEALDAIVSLATRRGAAPDRPGGSALRRLRTSHQGWNWGHPQDDWTLRSQAIADDGSLVFTGLERTASASWAGCCGGPVAYQPGSDEHLFSLLIDHEQEVLAGTFDFPPPAPLGAPRIIRQADHAKGEAFAAAGFHGTFEDWRLPPDWDPQRVEALRIAYRQRSCGGCHGSMTATSGNHIQPRGDGEDTAMSPFLEHIEIPRRTRALDALVCGPLEEPPACAQQDACISGDAPAPRIHELYLGPVGRFIELAGPSGYPLDGVVLRAGPRALPLDGFALGQSGYFVLAFDATNAIAEGAGYKVVPDGWLDRDPLEVRLLAGDTELDAVTVTDRPGFDSLVRVVSDDGTSTFVTAAPSPGSAGCCR